MTLVRSLVFTHVVGTCHTDTVPLEESTFQIALLAKRGRWSVADRRLVQSRALLKRQIQAFLQARVSLLDFLEEEAYPAE